MHNSLLKLGHSLIWYILVLKSLIYRDILIHLKKKKNTSINLYIIDKYDFRKIHLIQETFINIKKKLCQAKSAQRTILYVAMKNSSTH